MRHQNGVSLRTYDPKYTHYLTDGGGRDAFVNYNNGGFSAPRVSFYQESSAFMQKRIPQSPSPKKESAAIQYRPDGTGRDSYIYANSGGMKNISFAPYDERNYHNFLRSSAPQTTKYARLKPKWDQTADITSYLNWKPPRVQNQMTFQSLNTSHDFSKNKVELISNEQQKQQEQLEEFRRSYRQKKGIQLGARKSYLVNNLDEEKRKLLDLSLSKINSFKKEDLLRTFTKFNEKDL
eukprot:403349757